MGYEVPHPGTLKRKRRRREDKPAISAKLYLDSGLKGETGILSHDLADDLLSRSDNGEEVEGFLAVSPWAPIASPTGSSWTILPVRKAPKDERPLPASTIRFPASASGTQSLVNTLQALFPTRAVRQNATIEVRACDVVPLPLETVFVSVDSEALHKLDEVQKRYGGGFLTANGHAGHRGGKLAVRSPLEDGDEATSIGEERRKKLVHDALSAINIVHTGNLVPLPLSHAVTHASAPPARVLGC